MSVDFLYTILLLLALAIFLLCYVAHRHGCFSKRGWCYFIGFSIFLLVIGISVDYPAHFFTSHASATLQAQADSYLYLFDNMPSVPIRVVNEPIGKEHSVAHFDPVRKVIYVKQEYLNREQDLSDTIKHEMVHAWMQWKGKAWEANRSHGTTFQAKLREVLQEQ
jgi:hypothetical protein